MDLREPREYAEAVDVYVSPSFQLTEWEDGTYTITRFAEKFTRMTLVELSFAITNMVYRDDKSPAMVGKHARLGNPDE